MGIITIEKTCDSFINYNRSRLFLIKRRFKALRNVKMISPQSEKIRNYLLVTTLISQTYSL